MNNDKSTPFSLGKRTSFALVAFIAVSFQLAANVQLVLPEGRDSVAFPFMYESEKGDPEGLLLSDRQVMLRLGWDVAALHVGVEAMDEVLPGDGVTVQVNSSKIVFDLSGERKFAKAIPWADVGIKPDEGVKFSFDVQRTRAKGVRGADRMGVSSVTLSRKASRWEFSNPIHLGDAWFDTKLSFTGAADGKAGFVFNVWGFRPLNFYLNTSIAAKKGETKAVPVTGGSMDRGNLNVQIKDVDGTYLFRNTWKFRVNAPVAVRVIRSLPEKDQLLLETDNFVRPDEDYRVRLTMKDWDGDSETVWEKTVPAARCRGVTNQVYDVSDLKPGCYNAHYAVIAPDGRTVREGRLYYAKEDGKPEWLGLGLGEEDEVPQPWTPPVASDGEFACWGRSHRLGGKGLVEAILSQGRAVLDGPVAVVLNGERLEFDAKCVRRRNAGANYRLTSRSGGVEADLSAEFDGFLWFDVHWGGADAGEVRSLDVELPLNRKALAGMEIGPSGFFRVFGPTNAVWRIDPTRRPCFWAGDGMTGVMAGIDSIRGTHLKDPAGAFEVRVGPDGAALVMHLVDTPFTPSVRKTFGFYVEATPSHPKNMDYALVPREKICFWTGQVARFFDAALPGMMDEKRCATFRKIQAKGQRVHYYYSVKGTAPYQPWWGRFGQDWTRFNDPANWYNETKRKPTKDEATQREHGNWVRTCVNDRNFADHKIWTIDFLLRTPRYEAMDLYFDLAQPSQCVNERHGCVWKDDFGVTRYTWDVRAMRTMNLRAYRLLKRKNPRGVIIGHSGTFRGPSDVFFDRMVRGEHYCGAVMRSGGTYYGVLNPEDMQVKYASRSNEYIIDMLPQIVRGMSMYGKLDKLRTYDPLAPDEDRAIRHATAYFKIHDLFVATAVDGRRDGPQWMTAEKTIADLGADRKFRAYYHPDCPVKVAEPERLFLYACFSGNGRTFVIALNDTDETKTKTISVDGLSGVGRDIFKGGALDLSAGRATVTLPPRESRFWLFGE